MPPETIPSTASPTSTVLLNTAIRMGLMVAGPALASRGLSMDDATGETITGAVVTLAGISWSFWQKYQQARLDHEGSVISAAAGVARKAVS